MLIQNICGADSSRSWVKRQSGIGRRRCWQLAVQKFWLTRARPYAAREAEPGAWRAGAAARARAAADARSEAVTAPK